MRARFIDRRYRAVTVPLAGIAVGVLLAATGCSNSNFETTTVAAGLGCVDDSKACIDHRQAARTAMLADKNRGWVKEPATASAYASGVRMFAFKTEKPRLTCVELAAGRREADAAPTALRGPSGQGLSPAQISRGVMFAAEVGRELTSEMKRRCPAA